MIVGERDGGRRDLTNRLVASPRRENRCAGKWDGTSREPNTTQLLIDVAEGIDPGDGFLAEVAALCERNRLRGPLDLLRQIGLAEVLAVPGKTSFDAGRFKRSLADRMNATGGECGRGATEQRFQPGIGIERQEVARLPEPVDAGHMHPH